MAPSMKQAVLQDVLTEVQSLNIMRNSIRTAVSSIAYLRNLFEEEAFEDKVVADLPLKVLRPHNPEAELILSWLDQGVFDALEKKYLRLLLFNIHGITDELIECYHFKFSYGKDNSIGLEVSSRTASGVEKVLAQQVIQKKSCSKKAARDQTYQLLRNLILITQDLNPLPDGRYISMKLWYYDDQVPEDYEPAHFRPPVPEDGVLKFCDVPIGIHCGQISTGHHGLEIQIKTSVDTSGNTQMSVKETEDNPMKLNESDTGCLSQNLPPSLNKKRLSTIEVEVFEKARLFCNTQKLITTGSLRNALQIEQRAAKQVIDHLIQTRIIDKYTRKRKGFPVIAAQIE